MSWFVVDDQASVNRKHTALIRRGLEGDPDALAAGYLWMLVGSRLKAAYLDGVLDRFDLFAIMPDPRVLRMAELLVEVGLWHDHAHCCDRCERPATGRWAFHDWKPYYKRTGEEERMARALQAERKDADLKAEVWARDRLPKTNAQEPDAALCAYCRTTVRRDVKGGDTAPEIEHVFARPMGVDGLAISCRKCNRTKGARSAEEAGLTFHPTPAHARALSARTGTFSHPAGSAEMPATWTAGPDTPMPDGGRDDEPCPDGWVGHGSPPNGAADLPSDVVAASPPTSRGSSVPSRGSSVPAASQGGVCPDDAAQDACAPAQGVEWPSVTACVPETASGDRAARGGALEALRAAFGDQLPADLAVAALVADTGKDLTAAQQELLGAALAYARVSAPARAHAGALPGARAVAGQGRAGKGKEGQGTAGDRQGRGRQGTRRRRRAKKKPAICSEHGDRLPCRMCDYGEEMGR